ncbi:ABC transporter substrate-binding protein [Bradyrhizobium sp. AS23.2]|uniref:ABC transporter substrate-binding protein n=1 Tax=Bradyrhizobium sp. AS23.2 TaxID=1680155 RepID=UPI00095B9C46|nr:ABC transporter substrate-binding protein [Bradyrhizobium sp. AS23.2]OKO69305.1 ABC transporter permease [Bradyrhizobium sp. AS23.2]
MFVVSGASAQEGLTNNEVRIGILNDMSGPYSDSVGQGIVDAAQWAIDDFGGNMDGKPILLMNADTQLKADIASAIARRWIDENNVDALLTPAGTATTMAALELAKLRGITILNTGGVSSDLSGKACSELSTHWIIDTYAAAKLGVKAGAIVGAKSWFFVTADYAFGENLQRDAENEIRSTGGKTLGSVRAPINTMDFSSFLLTAQSSRADIIAMANAGGDTLNSLKQAGEFGIRAGGQKLIGLITNTSDIHALGLEAAQGLMLSDSYFWDRDDATRAFAKRFEAKFKRYPSQNHAAAYSATLHYLRAIKAAGTDNAKSVNAKMREMPVNDFFALNGTIRQDGRMIPSYVYLLEAKKPADSRSGWDLYNLIEKVPGDQAYRPLNQGGCPLVKN